MTDISRHDILRQAFEVCQEIEKCGASPELTNAVTKATALLRTLDDFIPKDADQTTTSHIPGIGPRNLSHGEVGKANQFKDLSRQFISLLREHGNDLGKLPPGESHFDAYEWCREADLAMKKACMFACRAISRPSPDC